MNRATAFILLLAGLLVFNAGGSTAYADDSAQAIAQYKKGRRLVKQKKYEEAIEALEASYDSLASPNTMLLMAHAERELGRNVEAARHYDQVIFEAEERVEDGEARFERTANDARKWLSSISGSIVALDITITNATPGTVVRVNGDLVETVRSSGGRFRAENVWMKPGALKIEAKRGDGEISEVSKVGEAGQKLSVEIDLEKKESRGSGDPNPLPQPQPTPPETKKGFHVPTGTWIAGGVGVAGFLTFTIFGLRAKSAADDLEYCSPFCPETERSTADDGKRDQTIANVGIIVSGLGFATAGGFLLFGSSSEDEEVKVSVGPGSVSLWGQF